MAIPTTITTPRTLLEAVNALLGAIRVSGVMSLNAADLNEDAASAKQALDATAREVQLRGWEFNTEVGIVLDPSPTGEVVLPQNALKARNIRCSQKRLTKRGLKLYDAEKHTFKIGVSVKLDIVVALEFDDMPESIKLYVTALAARRWCIPRMPTGSTFQYTEEVLNAAYAAAEEEDHETSDADLATTSPHFAKMRRR